MFSQPFTCGWILFSLTPPPHWVTPFTSTFYMPTIKAPPNTDDFSGTSIYSVYYTRKYSNHSPSAAWGGLPCGFQWSQGQKTFCLTYTSSTVYQIWFFGWIWPSHFIVYKSPQKWSQGQNPNCSTYTVSIKYLTPTMYAIYTTCRNATKKSYLETSFHTKYWWANGKFTHVYLLLFNVYFVDVRSNMHSIFVHIIMVRLFSLGICIFVCICAFVFSWYLYFVLYLCVCLLFVFNRFFEVGDKTCTASTTRWEHWI